MSKHFVFPFCVLLIIAVISLDLACIKITPKSGGGDIPVITPEIVGNPELDLPGNTTDIKVSSRDGTSYNKDGIIIDVPAGALTSDSKIALKEFTQSPADSEGDISKPEAYGISKLYDLGPSGIKFNKPVTVSIPYDKQLLNINNYEKNIIMAYFNGKDWISAGGVVDTTKGTVTAKFTCFPGFVIELLLTAAITVIGIHIKDKISNNTEELKYDGAAHKVADKYVMKDSPIISEWTRKAGFNFIPPVVGEHGLVFIPIEDPNNPGKINPLFIKAAPFTKRTEKITFAEKNGSIVDPKNSNKDAQGNDTNWTKPDKYFQNGLVGECTCHANAYLSIFRRLGFHAYGVEAYKDNSAYGQSNDCRHAWVEVVIGDEVYYYDNDEGLKPLKDIEHLLDRKTNKIPGDQQMWDENSQKYYVKDWWKQYVSGNPVKTDGDGWRSLFPQKNSSNSQAGGSSSTGASSSGASSTGKKWRLVGGIAALREDKDQDLPPCYINRTITVNKANAHGEVTATVECFPKGGAGKYTGDVTWAPPDAVLEPDSDIFLTMTAKGNHPTVAQASGGIYINGTLNREVNNLRQATQTIFWHIPAGSPNSKIEIHYSFSVCGLTGSATYTYKYE